VMDFGHANFVATACSGATRWLGITRLKRS